MDTAALYQTLVALLPTDEARLQLSQLVEDTFYCAHEGGFVDGLGLASGGPPSWTSAATLREIEARLGVFAHYTKFLDRIEALGPAVPQADASPV